MKPFNEGLHLEPNTYAIRLESLGEMAVVAAGLRHLETSRNLAHNPDEVRQLRQIVDRVYKQGISWLSLPNADKTIADNFAFSYYFSEPGPVALTKAAVDVVAGNPPQTTESPHLQDPLAHREALDMVADYNAELARLRNPDPPAEPPAR